jgi:glutaminyl-tRNA synthetase
MSSSREVVPASDPTTRPDAASPPNGPESGAPAHFIAAMIEADLASGRFADRAAGGGAPVRLRFPPEPNGYLHIGHVKSIVLNFGLAARYGGTCNLRYDDTNPEKESQEFVDAILRDVRWLGYEPAGIYFASDYFEQLYAWAELLVTRGLAYVDETPLEQLRELRGTVTEPGRPTPGRARTPDENLELLRQMRAGAFADGAMVLRARGDLAHPNMKLRDPLMYRIRHAHHHNTGDAWCIYPMYDWAHGQSDAIEGITHSLCTLEFENNNELYRWFLDAIGPDAVGVHPPPGQTEFAKLQLSYVLLSKRRLKELVDRGIVEGWDDPRMPTIAGLRARGIPPEALVAFAERVGVAKANSVVDIAMLEHTVRDVLNPVAPRRMAVLDPVPVTLDGWPEGEVRWLDAPDFPPDVAAPGSRQVPLGATVFIERADVAVVPPPGFRRLAPGRAIRLRYGPVVRAEHVEVGPDGEVLAVRARLVPDTFGVNPEGERVWATVHWAPGDAPPSEVRVIDRLFTHPDPKSADDPFEHVNPQSLVVWRQARLEPALHGLAEGARVQLERTGYAWRPPGAAVGALTLIVPLKDGWSGEGRGVEAAPAPSEDDPRASAEAQAALRARQRAEAMEADPALAAAVAAWAPAVGDEEAYRVASTPGGVAVLRAAVAAGAAPSSAAAFLLNVLRAERVEGDLTGVDGAGVGRLVALLDDGTLSAPLARKVLAVWLSEGGDPRAIAEARGWVAVRDEDALAAAVRDVLAANPAEVVRYHAGEHKLVGFFMGQVMQATRGKADPGMARRLLLAALSGQG